MLKGLLFLLASIGVSGAGVNSAPDDSAVGDPGYSLYGDGPGAEGFSHFSYVNPDAPKGGVLRVANTGSLFTSLNPHTLNGRPPNHPAYYALVYESLLEPAGDDFTTMHGRIAERVEVAEDLLSVTFHLRQSAHWNDGAPLTANDVAYSYELLTTQGHPAFRFLYGNVTSVEEVGEHAVRFDFLAPNRSATMTVGRMPILPRHYWEGRDFAANLVEAPVTSGPYSVAAVSVGRSIILERDVDYWGAHVPVNVGRFNWDQVVIEFYLDDTTAFQGFQNGDFDIWEEKNSQRWATGYDFPAVRTGEIERVTIPHARPVGMSGFLFNTRRGPLGDVDVRRAISLAFDFEWVKQSLLFDEPVRTNSYFENTPLGQNGAEASIAERALLEPYREEFPDAGLSSAFVAPNTVGDSLRTNLMLAVELLEAQGWAIEDGEMRNVETGEALTIEFLLADLSVQPVAAAYSRTLERIGIATNVVVVESSQYRLRLNAFDFDMIYFKFPQSYATLAQEQQIMWSPQQATVEGGVNYPGVNNPGIVAMATAIATATSLEELKASTGALDRLALWSHYVVPGWHVPYDRVAFADTVARPDVSPQYVGGIYDTWWFKSEGEE